MKQTRGTTPFPNVLLDVLMPSLTDTSWRILCIVVRQTLGWHVENGVRKREDWLSHSQLKRRSGRHSEAISRAIANLYDRGLIEIRSEDGDLLRTPGDRERHRGKHIYSLSSGVLSLIRSLSDIETRKSKATKQKETK